MKDGWKKKFKGNANGGAWIHTHPRVHTGRAIVENHNGFSYDGKRYPTLEAAKADALQKDLKL